MTASTDPRHELGRRGEDTAVCFLQSVGLQVIERNWRCRDGEIDIVALDQAADCLVVVEVKTRTSMAYGGPVAAVTWRKAARLRRLASWWLRDHPIGTSQVRIDVVAVLCPPRGRARIEHLRDVSA